jgi:hypothetical protein
LNPKVPPSLEGVQPYSFFLIHLCSFYAPLLNTLTQS